MPHMNGFELCEKILAIDINVKVCFMYSVEINREVVRDISNKIRMLYQKASHGFLTTHLCSLRVATLFTVPVFNYLKLVW